MIISRESRIGALLKKYPHLLDVLSNYNPHFRLLRNPIMRNTIAKVTTVERAAQVAGVSLRGLLKELNKAVGYELSREELLSIPEIRRGPQRPPPEVLNAKQENIVRLDVREILRNGGEPFSKIMETVRGLRDEQIFLLEVLFEPGPLYDVMERKQYLSYTEKVADEHYRVYFYKKGYYKQKETPEAEQNLEARKKIEGDRIILNVKGLEPPQPMEMILNTLAEMESGKTLIVHHERKPVYLLPKLEERGYSYEIEEKTPGKVIITIRKRA